VVPNPEREIFGAFVKRMVRQLTYDDCVRRGALCIAFKWVPRDLTNEKPCSTPGLPCDISCHDDMCFCIDGQCQDPPQGK
jgi:hypothetical protein